MRKNLLFAVLSASTLVAGPVHAHEGKKHEGGHDPAGAKHEDGSDHSGAKHAKSGAGDHPSPHGGQVKSVGDHRHFELVRRADGLDLYVYDADMKPAGGILTGASARVLVGKQKTEMAFTGADPAFKAAAAIPAGKMQVVVRGTLDGKAQNVKFTFAK